MLVIPTYSLLVTLASLGLPIAISKLIAEGKSRGKKIFLSIFPIVLIINILIIIVIFFLSPFIANTLLNEPKTHLLLIAMSLVVPFISLSSLIRGYFFGKQKMLPHTLSNVIEQIVRLFLIISIIPKLLAIGPTEAILGLILLNIVSEVVSIIIFLIFLPKNFAITKKDIKPDLTTIKEVFTISMASVSSRIIGNIGYFFEPIILTNLLLISGYSQNFIVREYGIYNAYSVPLLLVPSFFIGSIGTSLIPEISKFFAKGNILMVKKRIKQGLFYSFVIGLIFLTFMFIFAKEILTILYNTTSGVNYFRILAPFFLIFYLEAPLVSALQALNKATVTMKITTLGVIIKIIILSIGSIAKVGIYGLVISEIVNILFVVFYNFHEVNKIFKKDH
jgi:stage V sporulation protein B